MKRAIVTGGTKSDAAAIAVLAINIKETNADLFDTLIIYHDGIKKKDQERIQSIFHTEFIRYQYPCKSRNDVVMSYFSTMVFCKYECLKLLDVYDVVVWSDYDVTLEGSLNGVCEFSESAVNVLEDTKSIREMFYKKKEEQKYAGYDLERRGISMSLFALSNRLSNYNRIYQWCYEKTIEYDADIYLPEQCVFSLAMQEFHVDYSCMEWSQYSCHPRDAVGGETVLHAAGQPKFWNGLYSEHWERMYREWIHMGGTPYSDKKKRIYFQLRLIKNRLLGIRSKETV